MVRVRPLNEREIEDGARSCLIIDPSRPNSIMIETRPDKKSFSFDYVGGEESTQDDIFRVAAKPLALAALEGYNACIFAYGQTGAGKTFTIQGRGLDEDRQSAERGVQPRVLDYLFSLTNESTCMVDSDIEYLIKCSYYEIYNESIIDLLSNTETNLTVREDLKKGVYIEGLSEEITKNSEETIQLLLKGMRNRHIGSTNMNFESSRSHSVFSLTIESKHVQEGIINVKVSKLHFVDLAGSERQKQTAAVGERLKEASNINKSLTTLGLVINSLVESSVNGRNRHIPYRDSKLTFLLKDSLGGNSRTYMIAAVSSASNCFQETLSTLQFAQRAKMIKNKASINENAHGSVDSLKKEIKRLNDELVLVSTSLEIYKRHNGNKVDQSIEMEEEQDSQSSQLSSFKDASNKKPDVIPPQNDNIQKQNICEFDIKTLLDANNSILANEDEFEKHILFVQSLVENTFQPAIVRRDSQLSALRRGISNLETIELQYKDIMRIINQQNTIGKNEGSPTVTKSQIRDEDPATIQLQRSTIQAILNQLQEKAIKIIQENYSLKDQFGSHIETEVGEVILELYGIQEGIEKSVKDRKLMREMLEKSLICQAPSEVEQLQKVDCLINRMKKDHQGDIERFNFEIENMKEKSLALQRDFEEEKARATELKAEILKVKEQRANDLLSHSEQIEQILSEFTAQDGEKQMINQSHSVRILEQESKIANFKLTNSELNARMISTDLMIKEETAKRKRIAQEYAQLSEQKCDIERELIQTKKFLNLYKDENVLISKASQQFEELAKQLQESFNQEKQFSQKFEDQALKLTTQVQNIEEQMIEIRQQKDFYMDELSVVQDTLGFQNQEIELKQQEIYSLKLQIRLLEREIQDQKRIRIKKEESTLSEKTSLILSLRKEVVELGNKNRSLECQLEESKQDLALAQQSESHFKSAYQEVRQQLKKIEISNHELALQVSSKEVDAIEFKQQTEEAKQNVLVLQAKIKEITDQIKDSENQLEEAEVRCKKGKEYSAKLQENIRQNLDKMQQTILKNGELESQVTTQYLEIQQLKSQISSIGMLQEHKIDDLSQDLEQCRQEIDQLQKTINNKVEENINLAANNILLKNLQKQSIVCEIDMKKKQKELFDQISVQSNNYKQRIKDMVIQFGRLEKDLERGLAQQNSGFQIQKNKFDNTLIEYETQMRQKDLQIKQLNEQLQNVIHEKDEKYVAIKLEIATKDTELKIMHDKIAQTQIDILQAKKFYSNYSEIDEANKQLKIDKELLEASLKILEKQLNEYQTSYNSFQSQTESCLGKSKEQLSILEDNNTKLKKKYQSAREQLEHKAEETMELTTRISNILDELKFTKDSLAKVKVEKQQVINDRFKVSNFSRNDLPNDISSHIHQLCEFVLNQLQQTSKELLVSIPALSQTNYAGCPLNIQQDASFILYAFNNLFEYIKAKENSMQRMLLNEVKQNKRISSLEKDNVSLRMKVEEGRRSTSVESKPKQEFTRALTPKRSEQQQSNEKRSSQKFGTPSMKSNIFLPNQQLNMILNLSSIKKNKMNDNNNWKQSVQHDQQQSFFKELNIFFEADNPLQNQENRGSSQSRLTYQGEFPRKKLKL